MNNPAIPIATERLTLTALAPDHIDLLFTLLSNREHTHYLSLPTVTSSEEVQEMLDGLLSHPGNCLWIIKEKQNDAFVGLCGFLSDSSVPNFIYSIAEDKKGQGYAHEASEAAIEAGRRIHGSDLVELNIHSENKNSIRVAEKLGFTKTSEYETRYPQLSGPGMVQVFRRAYT